METQEVIRQNIFIYSCLVGLNSDKKNPAEDPKSEIKKYWWLNRLYEGYESLKDVENSTEIIQHIGSACARGIFSDIIKHKSYFNEDDTLFEVAEKLNIILGENIYKLRNNKLICIYRNQYCPAKSNKNKSSQTFCNCTLGWQKALFKTLLDKEVSAKLNENLENNEACEIIIEF
ncbi:hypothetical protein ACFLTE_04070 [Bacteroidota bacterium]